MKMWMKVLVAFIGGGSNAALTFSASVYPEWAMVFSYLVLAISGTMGIIIGWPVPKE